MSTRSIDHRIEVNPTAAWFRSIHARFVLYGLGMLIPALYFAGRYPLRGHTGELVDIGKLSQYQRSEFVWYCLALGLMFVCYAAAAIECRRLPRVVAPPLVFGVGAGLAACFAWMYPVNAIDVYIYAVRSRLWTEHGENPNAARPEIFWETDRYMHFGMAEWSTEVSPYGPLWNLVAAPATLIGGDNIAAALVVFKALSVVALVATGGVIYWALVTVRPERAATGALIWLWNPLVLWEGVGNAHNDIVLAVPLALAVAAWLRRRYAVVVPLLVVAALLKFVTLVLVPFATVAVWRALPGYRARLNAALVTFVLSVATCLVAFWPFYDVDAVVDSARRQSEFISTSPAAVIARWMTPNPVSSGVQDDLKRICLGLFALICLGCLAWVWRRPARLPRIAFEVIFAFLLIATFYFRAWYLVWPVALVAFLPLGWPFVRLTIWCVAALGTYGVYIWIWDWWGVEWVEIRAVGVVVTFLPPLALTVTGTGIAVMRCLRQTRAAAQAPRGGAD